ncbi:MAG: hypothetical protein SF097_02400 [Acidobacteriota bacterium]|nr:hypothetical protein [Acidobacteriota bacterium]
MNRYKLNALLLSSLLLTMAGFVWAQTPLALKDTTKLPPADSLAVY